MKNIKIPYYAVIFSSQRTEEDLGYGEMADEMIRLAPEQEGFLGVQIAQGEDGFGIAVSYWESIEAIKNWGKHLKHQIAQEQGKKQWYESFILKICEVESSKY